MREGDLGAASFVEVVLPACLLGVSLLGELFERADGGLCVLVAGSGLESVIWCGGEPAAPGGSTVDMCRSEVFGVERDGRAVRRGVLLEQFTKLVGAEVAVGTGEVSVDLVQRVVVGGLGVGP